MKKGSIVAIWSYTEHKFLKMYSEGRVGGSPYVKDGKLPDWWRAELFKVEAI